MKSVKELRQYEEESARTDALNRMILDFNAQIDDLSYSRNEWRTIAAVLALIALAAIGTTAGIAWPMIEAKVAQYAMH